MDGEIIFEKGVIRVTVRQLCDLWLEASDKCSADARIDIKQPVSFTDVLDFSVFNNAVEGDWL